jgi:hypothetical protein
VSAKPYLNPPERAVVLCVDSQPVLPRRPGPAARRTPDYLRHGTTHLLAGLDDKIGEFHRRHRAIEFRKFLETIDTAVPEKFDLHLDP